MGKSSSNVHSTAPDAYIVAFPYTKEETAIGDAFNASVLQTTPFIINKDIISVNTSKGKGSIGSWSVTLGSSKNYKALLHTGCWVMIYLNDQIYSDFSNGSKNDSGLKMLGQIKSLRVTEQTGGDGTRAIRYEISGDCFQNVFQSNIYSNSLLTIKDIAGTDDDFAQLLVFKKKASDISSPNQKASSLWSPSRFIKELIKALMEGDIGKGSDVEDSTTTTVSGGFSMPPEVTSRLGGSGSKLFGVMKLMIQKLPGVIAPQPDVGQVFTLWSLLKTHSHSILNEIYADLIDVGGTLKPAFVMRAIPFSSSSSGKGNLSMKENQPRFGLYVSKTIKEHEILALNYGKHDAERFNFFIITSPYLTQEGREPAIENLIRSTGGLDKISNKSDIARNGVRPFITTTEYMTKDIATVNATIRDMWGKAHLYENGQVVIVGSHQHIPVGSNVEFEDRGWKAHVEAVSHHYNVGGDGHKEFTTTISFVRLQTKEGSPIDLIESNKDAQRPYDRGVTHSEGDK